MPVINEHLKIGQTITLTIKKLGINGEGIGYWKKTLIFVPWALPTETIQCQITQVQANFARGKLLSYQKPGPQRNLQAPALAQQVGGLELAHLKYPAQLHYKQEMIAEAFRHFHLPQWRHYDIRPTIGMEDPWHYRNKAQFSIRQQDGHLVCGLFQTGTQTVVDSLEMPTQSSLTLHILQQLLSIISQLQLPIYDPQQNSGILKTLIVRQDQAGSQAQLTFVTNSRKLPRKRELLDQIQVQIPEVTGIFQNFNPGSTSLIWGNETKKLWGQDYLTETLGDYQYQLSPRAFFQLNPHQTLKLYAQVRQALKPQTNDIVVDAYAGVGTIGISLAHQVQQVLGSEIIPEAVADANLNVQLNQLSNINYELGATEELYPQWLQQGIRPTAVVVDPPRTGLATSLSNYLLQSQPAKIVYTSCNPATLARDLKLLSKKYRIDFIQPLDMFPQTPHVESVTRLTLRTKK
ncbi:23S rRNA (uracil(1939)-C(5))-methyltransferase RlmD [Bombilactobacillus apium]|uniref:23S rRNA (uracil(1939)-C(5))-methyltransferase RlmD n=1 Tax=Bombilactobacillus apium TaxID=2675299 RepID=UPI001892B5B8|nr:23S rRNA (uracil(1939)-C(5))-methyltransferase RlmD [Bombilactobacillus apium]